MINRLRKLITWIENWEKKNPPLFYGLVIFIFLILELSIILGVKKYKIYRFKQLQAKSEKEMRERLLKKLDDFQVRILKIE